MATKAIFILVVVVIADHYGAAFPRNDTEMDASMIEPEALHVSKMDFGVLATICEGNINTIRAQNGKGPVSTNARVEQAAYNHNLLMMRTNCFSHQCPGEPALGDRLSSTGYTWSGAGEILAKGQGDCAAAVNAWFNSGGHRDIMLGNFVHVGCSGLTCSDCADRGPWWTCVFASPR